MRANHSGRSLELKDYLMERFFFLLLTTAMVIMMNVVNSASAAPSCPLQTVSSTYTVMINSQQELIGSFTNAVYGQSDCVIFSVLSTNHYAIDLTQLLAL